MRDATSSGVLSQVGFLAHRPSVVFSVLTLLFPCFAGHAARAESYTVTIQVFGADHKAVSKAEASLFWQVKDGVMTSVSDESAASDAAGKMVLRFSDRNENRPVLIFSPDRKLGGILGISKTNNGKELTVTLGPTVRARGQLSCSELNAKPKWANTMVTPDGFQSRFAQHMGNSADFNFVLPAGKYSFNSYGSDVGNHTQRVTLVAENPDLDLGTIDLKATAIAKLKGKPAPTWDVTAARGVKRTAKLSDYKGRWVYLEFWGFW
jgi:hypothetical protein